MAYILHDIRVTYTYDRKEAVKMEFGQSGKIDAEHVEEQREKVLNQRFTDAA